MSLRAILTGRPMHFPWIRFARLDSHNCAHLRRRFSPDIRGAGFVVHVLTFTDSCQPMSAMSALSLTTHHDRDEGARYVTRESSSTVSTSIKSSCHDPPGSKLAFKTLTDKLMTNIDRWRWRWRCCFKGGGHE